MGRALIIIGTLLITALLVLGACAPTPAPEPAPTPTPAPTPPVEPEKPEISFPDPSRDLFRVSGPPTAEDYLDIIETGLSLSNGYYLAKIKVNKPLPTKIDDPSIFIEWDILLDSDCDSGTGWNWPLICNDIGADYLLRLELKNSEYKGSVLNIKTQKWGSIEYEIEGSIVELRFPSEAIGKPANFNFVVAVRKYGEGGAPEALLIADKAPNEGHYVFPNHHTSLESTQQEDVEELRVKIHKDAWSKFVSQAENDTYLKYSIYAFRTLAVKHPEIYLQGDNILAEVLTTNAGSKEAYETKDVHSDYFYKPWKQGASFSFDDVDFTKYKLVSCQELYPSNYPFLPFLDRRLDLITTTLKTFDDRITELEKAEQLYFAEKKKGYKELYLIYCDNENAYLYRDASLISATEQKEAEQPEGNPILIFNEENVWYPLMERDDTDRSKVLSELVATYSTNVKEPELSDFEKGLIPKLKEVTEFTDARNLTFLKLGCINASIRMASLMPQGIKREFEESRLVYFLWCDRALNEKMNLFSPISAHLAVIAKEKEGKTGIEAMCAEYAKHTRTAGYRFSHGHIWSCAILEYGIEHTYRARAGHCVVQAAAIGAALELAGIDSYRLQGFATSDGEVAGHDFIYVPQYDLIISNARPGTLLDGTIGGTVIDSCKVGKFKYIDFIEHDGKWAYLWRTFKSSMFYGTLSPNETIKILDYLRGIHNEDIQGRRMEGGEIHKDSI